MFEDLDHNLPGQAWKLLDMKKYKAHNWHTFGRLDTINTYASLQTSLGCPFKCTFCCINAPFERNTIRFWSPKHIIKQIKKLRTIKLLTLKYLMKCSCLILNK